MKNLIKKILNEVTNPYNINWVEPDEKYFIQELDELLGNGMRFSKDEFFHPKNYNLMYSLLPHTFKLIAEHSIGDIVNDSKEIKEILINEEINDLMGDWEDFRDNLIRDKKSRQEGLNIFRMGELVDWSDELINTTYYMGKPSKVFKGNPILGIDKTSSQMIKRYSDFEKGYSGNLNKFRTAAKEKRSENLPPPFVMGLPSGGRDGNEFNLIGGHKRSSMANQLNVPIKVWLINLS